MASAVPKQYRFESALAAAAFQCLAQALKARFEIRWIDGTPEDDALTRIERQPRAIGQWRGIPAPHVNIKPNLAPQSSLRLCKI
jgi:hypothetical protein